MIPRTEWSNSYNQKQLRETDMHRFLVSSEVNGAELENIIGPVEYVTVDTLVMRLPEVLKTIDWVLLEVNEDWLLFATNDKNRDMVKELRTWCERLGLVVV